MPDFPPCDLSACDGKAPSELFELFFDDKIIQHIVDHSQEYCSSKNWANINVTKEEIRCFLGILLVTGYNRLPSKANYWAVGKDLRNEAIYKAMKRDRFDSITKCLHFQLNSELDKEDKYSKIRPLITHLQKKFVENFILTKHISHDEAMVEYFGKHDCKQSIRNKPIRFGYKVWCQNTTAGYLIAFDPYQGKTYNCNSELEEKIGKTPSTVLHLIQNFYQNKSNLPYHLYFDNLFTTLPLLQEIHHLGYNATGTMRSNRIDNKCPLSSVQTMAKMERRRSEVVTADMKNCKIFVTRWKDNAVVTVASTMFGKEPEGKAKRWSKAMSKSCLVDIPLAIQTYNKKMGRTDRMDQNINAYRIGIRGKKW